MQDVKTLWVCCGIVCHLW